MGSIGGGRSALKTPSFQPFLNPDFDVAQFTSSVLAGSHTTAQAQAEQLREGVRVLEGELGTEVTARSGELMGIVKRTSHAETTLQDIVLSVDSLQSTVRRIRSEIVGPYENVKARTLQLRNLHETIEMLRLLIHRVKLMQKLKVQMAAPAASLDLAKAAKLITDISNIDKERDLSGIVAVAADQSFLKDSTASVRQQAEEALIDGMESMSQAKVGSALQVLFNLEELQQAINARMTKSLSDIERAAKAALDLRQLGGPSRSPGGLGSGIGVSGGGGAAGSGSSGGGSWQEKLWIGLRETFEALQSGVVSVWHLQRVVAKKKDPLTHVCFLDQLVKIDQPLLTQRFWTEAMRVLTEVFASAAKPGKTDLFRPSQARAETEWHVRMLGC
jgi:hypothetical protein